MITFALPSPIVLREGSQEKAVTGMRQKGYRESTTRLSQQSYDKRS